MLKDSQNNWFVYILSCADDTLYTGITVDLERRLAEHNDDDKLGAKYTRARRPVYLVYKEVCESKSMASKRECEIKKLSRSGKIKMIEQSNVK